MVNINFRNGMIQRDVDKCIDFVMSHNISKNAGANNAVGYYKWSIIRKDLHEKWLRVMSGRALPHDVLLNLQPYEKTTIYHREIVADVYDSYTYFKKAMELDKENPTYLYNTWVMLGFWSFLSDNFTDLINFMFQKEVTDNERIEYILSQMYQGNHFSLFYSNEKYIEDFRLRPQKEKFAILKLFDERCDVGENTIIFRTLIYPLWVPYSL